jgi:hypothetical protein
MIGMNVLDGNTPVVVGIAASVVAVASWKPVKWVARKLWEHNIQQPVSDWVDGTVEKVVKRVKAKDGNGGYGLNDLGQHLEVLDGNLHDLQKQVVVLNTGTVMNREMLQAVRKTGELTADQLEHHMEAVRESGILRAALEDRIEKKRGAVSATSREVK